MTGAALVPVPSPDVAALEGLPVNEIDAAFGVAWQSFGRRTVVDAWHLGRALRRVKDGRGRHFRAYCESIGMSRSWSYDLLIIADAPLEKVSVERTLSAAVKALRPAPAAPEPTATTAPSRNGDQGTAATVDRPPVEAVEAPPAAVVEAVAAEATPDPIALRDERLERLAIRTEDIAGSVVDGWAEQFDRQAARELEHVEANRASAKREAAKDRKLRDICDALLAAPGCPTCAEVLARFYSVQRKGAA